MAQLSEAFAEYASDILNKALEKTIRFPRCTRWQHTTPLSTRFSKMPFTLGTRHYYAKR